MLQKVIASYQCQRVPVEIIVHDNGSDDPDTIQILNRLEHDGVRVFRRGKIEHADDLNLVNETVSAVFSSRNSSPYIVTDCDVELSGESTDAISTYLEMLSVFPDAECIGPMLRIDDIRKSYPLFGRVMNLHIRQFWHQQPQIAKVGGRDVAFIRAPIDTTFAVHRARQPFRRLKQGIRVYAPFDGRHLDWYSHEQTEAYRHRSSSGIAHWSNRGYETEFGAEPLQYESYIIARHGHIENRSVADNHD